MPDAVAVAALKDQPGNGELADMVRGVDIADTEPLGHLGNRKLGTALQYVQYLQPAVAGRPFYNPLDLPKIRLRHGRHYTPCWCFAKFQNRFSFWMN